MLGESGECIMFDSDEQGFMDEELEAMFFHELEDVAADFQLKWEPKASDLYGLLEAYTKDQLLDLCDLNRVDIRKSWTKAEIINKLERHILDTLPERLLLLEDFQLDLLIQYAENGHAFESKAEEMLFMMAILPQAVKMGLLFVRNEKDHFEKYVPLELVEMIDRLEQLQRDTEIQARLEFPKRLREILQASINLYGVFKLSRLINLWEIKYPKDELSREFLNQFNQHLPLLMIQNDCRWVGSLIVSPNFETDMEAVNLYTEIQAKMGMDFYQPTAKEISYYSKHPVDRRSTHYKRLKRLVNRLSENPEYVMGALETNLMFGHPLSAVMNELSEQDLLIFDSQRQVEQFAEHYIYLHNHTRLWENAGYMPVERRPDPLPDDMYSIYPAPERKKKKPIIRVKKIGRNDPCPCGSGKKYKKCCLRK